MVPGEGSFGGSSTACAQLNLLHLPEQVLYLETHRARYELSHVPQPPAASAAGTSTPAETASTAAAPAGPSDPAQQPPVRAATSPPLSDSSCWAIPEHLRGGPLPISLTCHKWEDVQPLYGPCCVLRRA